MMMGFDTPTLSPTLEDGPGGRGKLDCLHIHLHRIIEVTKPKAKNREDEVVVKCGNSSMQFMMKDEIAVLAAFPHGYMYSWYEESS